MRVSICVTCAIKLTKQVTVSALWQPDLLSHAIALLSHHHNGLDETHALVLTIAALRLNGAARDGVAEGSKVVIRECAEDEGDPCADLSCTSMLLSNGATAR